VLVALSVRESARMFRLNVWDSLRNFVCDNFHGAGLEFCERSRNSHFDRISASSRVESVLG
jgi:hypothetical protein